MDAGGIGWGLPAAVGGIIAEAGFTQAESIAQLLDLGREIVGGAIATCHARPPESRFSRASFSSSK